MFELLKSTPQGRRGRIETMHGPIETPVFFPVATCGAMRGISFGELEQLDPQVLLCNTYHLHLQPGENTVAEAGGLHEFIGWNKPILTDSGGFQVFSLRSSVKLLEHGVEFQSHLDGTPLFIGPKEAMEIQHKLGSDIIMCFDECPPSTAPREKQIEAIDRTVRWAKECKEWHEKLKKESGKNSLLFAIVQGGLEEDLRIDCAKRLIEMDFDGYAIGGLAVGETEEEMYRILDIVCPLLPEDKPRYLMGVGKRHQHAHAISKGIDMFDCVLPMREARHGNIHMSDGSALKILNAQYKHDHTPLDQHSPSPLSQRHTKSYLHHMLKAKERYGETIACMQNLGLTLENIRVIRERIESDER